MEAPESVEGVDVEAGVLEELEEAALLEDVPPVEEEA